MLRMRIQIMKCPKCGYEWRKRVSQPKVCPRCRHRLDYPRRTG